MTLLAVWSYLPDLSPLFSFFAVLGESTSGMKGRHRCGGESGPVGKVALNSQDFDIFFSSLGPRSSLRRSFRPTVVHPHLRLGLFTSRFSRAFISILGFCCDGKVPARSKWLSDFFSSGPGFTDLFRNPFCNSGPSGRDYYPVSVFFTL